MLVNTEKLSLETSNPERRYCAATSTATTTHARHKYLLRLCSCRQANRLPLFRCASMLKRVELNSDEVTESRPRQSQIQVLSPYRPYPYPGPYQGNKDFLNPGTKSPIIPNNSLSGPMNFPGRDNSSKILFCLITQLHTAGKPWSTEAGQRREEKNIPSKTFPSLQGPGWSGVEGAGAG